MKTINKKRIYENFLIIGIMAIMLCSLVSAIGVASPPSPVRLYPSEERIFLLTLQNIDVDGEITVSGEVVGGSEIASLDKDSYKVSYNSLDTSARLKIKIPESAVIGQTYKIAYEFKQALGETEELEGTGASFSTGVKSGFEIEVIPKPPETPAEEGISATWWVLGVIALIVVIAVIWFLVKGKEDNVSVKSAKK